MRILTHKIVGGCFAVGALSLAYDNMIDLPMHLNAVNNAAMFAGTILGSGLPDIDHPKSHIGSKFFFLSHFIEKVSRLSSRIGGKYSGHRGPIHTPIVNLMLYMALFYVGELLSLGSMYQAVILGISIGFASHLIADFLNPKGIMIFYPVFKSRISLIGFKSGTGDVLAVLLFVPLTMAIVMKKYMIF